MTTEHPFSRSIRVTFLFALLATAPQSWAQQGDVFAYPNAGQSVEQQKKDQAECNQWAVGQSGFDPARSSPPQQMAGYSGQPSSGSGLGSGEVGQGGMIGDGARGAAGGAMIGAIAGDAGKGAAYGAAAGALFGGMKRNARKQEEAQWQQQQQAQAQQQYQAQMHQYQQAMYGYQRAFGACMSSRNYRVQ